MSVTRFDRIRDLFDQACELPAAERMSFVERACGQDQALKQDLESLLVRASGTADELRAAPSTQPLAIGPYRVTARLGEGAFGVVYLAERLDPHQEVAIKVLRPGLETEQVLARFGAERQAVALMDHAHVARLLDAGMTEDQRPYFVMEYVRGLPITEFCDENDVDVAGRLALFLQVCDAIQHAHQKGIIHRDLKPANVLVTAGDGKAVAKVIDFGIAKATTGIKLADGTLATGFFLGTPAYMSPEQAGRSPEDVDTRSDIYSLGVLLYELLTGALPLEESALREAALAEVLRMIQDVEPRRPSTRVTALGESGTAVARKRGTEVRFLTRTLREDLDWVTMKALEKDRARRYASAAELAADVGRYLRGEPVSAGPPTWRYRFRKFQARNRLLVGSVVTVAVVLILGIVGTTTMSVAATRNAERVSALNQDLEALAKVSIKALNAILVDSLDPAFSHAGRMELATSIAKVMRHFETATEDERDQVNSVFDKLAHGPNHAGRIAEAAELWRLGVDTVLHMAGQDYHGTYIMQRNLGTQMRRLGKFAEAEDLFRRSWQARAKHDGDADPNVVGTRFDLADVLERQGKLQEADAHLEALIDIRRKTPGSNANTLPMFLEYLGTLRLRQSAPGRAEPLLREASARRDKRRESDPVAFGRCQSLHGACLSELGQRAEAETVLMHGLEALEAATAPAPEIEGAIERLIRHHERGGEPARADAWRARLEAARRAR